MTDLALQNEVWMNFNRSQTKSNVKRERKGGSVGFMFMILNVWWLVMDETEKKVCKMVLFYFSKICFLQKIDKIHCEQVHFQTQRNFKHIQFLEMSNKFINPQLKWISFFSKYGGIWVTHKRTTKIIFYW